MPPSELPPKEGARPPCRFPHASHTVLSDWGICGPAVTPSHCTHQGVQPGFPHITYSQQCAVRASAPARFCNRVTLLFPLARSASLDCSSGGRVSYDAASLSLLCSALPCAQRGRTPLQDRSVWRAGGAAARRPAHRGPKQQELSPRGAAGSGPGSRQGWCLQGSVSASCRWHLLSFHVCVLTDKDPRCVR